MYKLGAKYTTTKFYCQEYLKEKARRAKKFFMEERGDTTIIAIILVLVVVIALALVFRKNIAELASNIWSKIFTNADVGGQSTDMQDSWDQ